MDLGTVSLIKKRILPKLQIAGVSRARSLPLLEIAIEAPIENWPESLLGPWFWYGAKKHQTTINPVALMRSPGPPIFYVPKDKTCQAHRLLFHCLVAPLTPYSQLRYTGLKTDLPNVNPAHYRHVELARYHYEPPTMEEVTGRSDVDDLAILIAGGASIEALLQDYTEEEINQAKERLI